MRDDVMVAFLITSLPALSCSNCDVGPLCMTRIKMTFQILSQQALQGTGTDSMMGPVGTCGQHRRWQGMPGAMQS